MVVQTPEITQRVHHATDEEKLASTSIMGQATDRLEDRGETKCNKVSAKTQPGSDISAVDGKILYCVIFKTFKCRPYRSLIEFRPHILL